MITKESLQILARSYQTSEFPNIVREYFQHLPADQQAIIRDFPRALDQEMSRQLASLG